MVRLDSSINFLIKLRIKYKFLCSQFKISKSVKLTQLELFSKFLIKLSINFLFFTFTIVDNRIFEIKDNS